ncbi:hypothetical protein quinque_013530 [Culex quinquefasciatus]
MYKADRYWVVFCVHDDCEAFLEGYLDPRQAPSHSPEWSLSLQTVQHVSHALVSVEQEFEFVITLSTEVARFNANTWECMQEWVESLRSKLREMKLLSPKENLYSKLPEIKPPLAPTRDPTSPLPATPPVPAAIVPGIERVQPLSNVASSQHHTPPATAMVTTATTAVTTTATTSASNATPLTSTTTNSSGPQVAMSNTSTQNLMNLLTNPLQAVSSINNQHISSQYLFDAISLASDLSDSGSLDDYSNDLIKRFISSSSPLSSPPPTSANGGPSGSGSNLPKPQKLTTKENGFNHSNGAVSSATSSLATTFVTNVLADPGTTSLKRSTSDKKVLVDVRADSSSGSSNSSSNSSSSSGSDEDAVATSQSSSLEKTNGSSPKTRNGHRNDPKKTRRKSPHKSSESSANVTIIQVSNGTTETPNASPSKSVLCSQKVKHRMTTAKTKLSNNNNNNIIEDLSDDNYKSNVQIIPSNIEYDHHPLLPDQEPSIIASINDRQITTVTVPNLVNGSSTSGGSNVIITTASIPAVQSTVIATVATSSTPIKSDSSNFGVTQIAVGNLDQPTSLQSPPTSSGSSVASKLNKSKVMLLSKQQRSSSHSEIQLNRVKNLRNGQGNKENQSEDQAPQTNGQSSGSSAKVGILSSASSPAVPASHVSPSKRAAVDKNIYTPQPQRPMLQRGLTEMVISRSTNAVVTSGRDLAARGRQAAVVNHSAEKVRNEVNEQRRRSSSTSDAQPETSGNPVMRVRQNGALASRLQSPPQPFRPHHQLINQLDPGGAPSNRKMTLREQQVMQLRREMMHPGGVRLQLRRKDCVNSIGLVDAFGAVWVAGWKQKEHPVLYNALHIGDQLISVAGVAITSAAEAHKTIRGAPGLFVELIIRRVPFGRVYAIRRELDGQCLGLIRDGNTSTIVDVVPNSLAARHGLPPKAKSCDGLSLTFWVLTEINGRPLNLFFKENEIRDRLNAVGRDISILVQPADLVTKLKKQLKSLRGHKDFIVQ